MQTNQITKLNNSTKLIALIISLCFGISAGVFLMMFIGHGKHQKHVLLSDVVSADFLIGEDVLCVGYLHSSIEGWGIGDAKIGSSKRMGVPVSISHEDAKKIFKDELTPDFFAGGDELVLLRGIIMKGHYPHSGFFFGEIKWIKAKEIFFLNRNHAKWSI